MIQTNSKLDQLAEKLARERYRRTGIPFPFERINMDVRGPHWLVPARLDIEFLVQEGFITL